MPSPDLIQRDFLIYHGKGTRILLITDRGGGTHHSYDGRNSGQKYLDSLQIPKVKLTQTD